jgi:hypothetical protein
MRKWMRAVWGAVGVVLLGLLAAFLYLQYTRPTYADFLRVKEGMTEEEVKAVLGTPELEWRETSGETKVMYWTTRFHGNPVTLMVKFYTLTEYEYHPPRKRTTAAVITYNWDFDDIVPSGWLQRARWEVRQRYRLPF